MTKGMVFEPYWSDKGYASLLGLRSLIKTKDVYDAKMPKLKKFSGNCTILFAAICLMLTSGIHRFGS